jgi:hypothetical protein
VSQSNAFESYEKLSVLLNFGKMIIILIIECFYYLIKSNDFLRYSLKTTNKSSFVIKIVPTKLNFKKTDLGINLLLKLLEKNSRQNYFGNHHHLKLHFNSIIIGFAYFFNLIFISDCYLIFILKNNNDAFMMTVTFVSEI